mgnify:CR=1 FL=1
MHFAVEHVGGEIRDLASVLNVLVQDEDGVGIVGMDGHGEAEIGHHAPADVLPRFPEVLAAVKPAVVLEKEPFGPGGMLDKLVHALPALGLPVREEVGPDPLVAGVPAAPPVIGPVDAAPGDPHVETAPVGRIRKNRVKAEAAARLPTRPGGMVMEPLDKRPDCSAVPGLEERRGSHSAIQDVGLIAAARPDLPDLLQRGPGAGGELYRRDPGRRPVAAEIVGEPQHGAFPGAATPGPQAPAPAARIEGRGVDVAPGEMGAAHLPGGPLRPRRAKEEETLGRADQEQDVAVPDRDLADRDHGESPEGRAPFAGSVPEEGGH